MASVAHAAQNAAGLPPLYLLFISLFRSSSFQITFASGDHITYYYSIITIILISGRMRWTEAEDGWGAQPSPPPSVSLRLSPSLVLCLIDRDALCPESFILQYWLFSSLIHYKILVLFEIYTFRFPLAPPSERLSLQRTV